MTYYSRGGKKISEADMKESVYLMKLALAYLIVGGFVLMFKGRLGYGLLLWLLAGVAFVMGEKYKQESDEVAGEDTRWSL